MPVSNYDEHNKRTDGKKDAKVTTEMAKSDPEDHTSGNSHRVKNFAESSFGHHNQRFYASFRAKVSS